uniref:uncharacterized protein LOC122586003 n=1 Tax=Erigeron canadensis TaxID=72917 RepID=UPI001CB8ABE4|nr:uncharacterized protein LOC122586003 [Erigeron canadensis]
MFQGNLVERGCLTLCISGVAISRVFGPCLLRREKRYRMQLPENWYNDFSGFLFCTASTYNYYSTKLKMTHDKLEGGDDNKSVVVDCPEDDIEKTCVNVWYIPFGSLRNTLWWDPTSTAIQFEFESRVWWCGTTSFSDVPSFDDDYTCTLRIENDSKSTLECYILKYI